MIEKFFGIPPVDTAKAYPTAPTKGVHPLAPRTCEGGVKNLRFLTGGARFPHFPELPQSKCRYRSISTAPSEKRGPGVASPPPLRQGRWRSRPWGRYGCIPSVGAGGIDGPKKTCHLAWREMQIGKCVKKQKVYPPRGLAREGFVRYNRRRNKRREFLWRKYLV